jgi:hypothetical protein
MKGFYIYIFKKKKKRKETWYAGGRNLFPPIDSYEVIGRLIKFLGAERQGGAHKRRNKDTDTSYSSRFFCVCKKVILPGLAQVTIWDETLAVICVWGSEWFRAYDSASINKAQPVRMSQCFFHMLNKIMLLFSSKEKRKEKKNLIFRMDELKHTSQNPRGCQ